MDIRLARNQLKVGLLASGSSGNSILMATPESAILIDAGLSGRQMEFRLRQTGFEPDQLDAIFVTHEHIDHIRGVGVLARKWHLPVFISEKTFRALGPALGTVPHVEFFEPGKPILLGGFDAYPYSVPHDAVDPVAFSVRYGDHRIGVALDLGRATKLVRERLKRSEVLILEFNHDSDMVRASRRPWAVKQRILSSVGHLSNEDALDLMTDLLHDDLKAVFSVHLSRDNNHPNLVRSMITDRLSQVGRTDITVFVTDQDEVSPLFEL